MMKYTAMLFMGALVSTLLAGCSAPVEFTPESIVLVYGDPGGSYKLEYKFNEEESRAICGNLNSSRLEIIHVLDATWYLCRIEISAADSPKELQILQGERLSIHDLDGNGESYRIVANGFFDLIKKRLYGLEMEYLGGYPIATIPEGEDMLEPRLIFALERASKELGLPFGPTSGPVDALRKFQEWYKANKDKIKWDEKQNKYIVTE